ncbi:hypothetical protein [Streptomyces formicae]|uniref:Uncharacterized protein n=1 Tax=Streptomyces formicae TaxID=1616117 RepID=A0A291Q775_9ACTN|nr:hypothetical protein [Streptomyces formicae]ATL27581.1 hypothetical protein KY5_2563 [Streptomyces formicae]
MGLFNRSDLSDDDLAQSMQLESEMAADAHLLGNHQREDAAHASLNENLDEAEQRGWSR